jgi:hypothetical protein
MIAAFVTVLVTGMPFYGLQNLRDIQMNPVQVIQRLLSDILMCHRVARITSLMKNPAVIHTFWLQTALGSLFGGCLNGTSREMIVYAAHTVGLQQGFIRRFFMSLKDF